MEYDPEVRAVRAFIAGYPDGTSTCIDVAIQHAFHLLDEVSLEAADQALLADDERETRFILAAERFSDAWDAYYRYRNHWHQMSNALDECSPQTLRLIETVIKDERAFLRAVDEVTGAFGGGVE